MASSAAAFAQLSNDPFPQPIAATEGVVKVNFKEFASLPDSNGQNARMMLLIDEPGTKRLFVNDMNGPLYTISYDGKTVTPYVNINDETPRRASHRRHARTCGLGRGPTAKSSS